MFHSLIFSPPLPDSMEEASALANSVGILAKRVLGEQNSFDVSFLIK
jgi:hypothetical protein